MPCATFLRRRRKAFPSLSIPVMVAKGGASLLETEAVATLKRRMILLATVLTPNIPEAQVLAGRTIRDRESAQAAGMMLSTLGPKYVLVKGGHLAGDSIVDLLFEDHRLLEAFTGPRLDTPNTHGTGCTTASAIRNRLGPGVVRA